MNDIMDWAREAGYYAEERRNGDAIYVSKTLPIGKNTSNSVPSEKTVAFFQKLLKLLATSAPQADDYFVCSLDGEIIAEYRTMKKTAAEEKCLAELLPRLRRKSSLYYPETTADGAYREYWAFPFLTNGGVCKYALVCHGRCKACSFA